LTAQSRVVAFESVFTKIGVNRMTKPNFTRTVLVTAFMLSATSSVYPAEASKLFSKFPESDYGRVKIGLGPEQLGRIASIESSSYMIFSKNDRKTVAKSAMYSVLTFKDNKTAEAAIDAYFKEADPVRAHAIGWELVVAADNRVYKFSIDRGLSKGTFLGYAKAILDETGPKATKIMMCEDIGRGCWLEDVKKIRVSLHLSSSDRLTNGSQSKSDLQRQNK
jgi:hypothetical protein